MEDSGIRGSGRTTFQMKESPLHAIYIWCNTYLDYPKLLAKRIGREDLKIVSPSWLMPEKLHGIYDLNIIVDHAANLSYEQLDNLVRYLDMVKSYKK